MRVATHGGIACCALVVLSACTSAGATKRGVVRFNEVFAQSRNEILLTNILRARFGEAQQYSTVPTVTGNMRASIELAGGLNNLILGAAETFNPSGSVGLRNPSVTISALETKEFREGMMKPVNLTLVSELLASGWEPDVVMNLVVAGVQCTRQSGMAPPQISPPVKPISVSDEQWRVEPGEPQVLGQSVLLKVDEAAKLLRDGAGNGVKPEIIKPEKGDPRGMVRLEFRKDVEESIHFGNGTRICGKDIKSIGAKQLRLRSPSAMV